MCASLVAVFLRFKPLVSGRARKRCAAGHPGGIQRYPVTRLASNFLGRTILISFAASIFMIGQAGATVYNLSFVSAGWDSDLGDQNPSPRSHLTGEIFIPVPGEKRSFGVFILSLFR